MLQCESAHMNMKHKIKLKLARLMFEKVDRYTIINSNVYDSNPHIVAKEF